MIHNLENVSLLRADVETIGHCCNCFCTMGSGIARQIRENFPEAYTADCKTIKGDRNKLGKFSVAEVWQKTYNLNIKYIYNLYGQYNYGTESRKLNYEAIYNALESMSANCQNVGVLKIGFPKNMGCTLAGGKWPIVNEMIKTIFDENFEVYICQYTNISQ